MNQINRLYQNISKVMLFHPSQKKRIKNTSEYTTLAAVTKLFAASRPCGTHTALDIGRIVSSASHG